MEFDASTHSAQSWKGGRESIELWDISGDKKFEKCFPAIMKGAVGVILVYNPDDAEHVNQLQYWCGPRLTHPLSDSVRLDGLGPAIVCF